MHVIPPRSYAFPNPLRTHQLFGILYLAPSWKEVCGMMANLVADFGGNERQLSNLVEAFVTILEACPLQRKSAHFIMQNH